MIITIGITGPTTEVEIGQEMDMGNRIYNGQNYRRNNYGQNYGNQRYRNRSSSQDHGRSRQRYRSHSWDRSNSRK